MLGKFWSHRHFLPKAPIRFAKLGMERSRAGCHTLLSPTTSPGNGKTMYGQQQLAYAPTPYSYTPSSNLTATINLDEEVKLADTPAERDLYESLAELYSIIITLDALEKAYLRDSIKESEYTETCDRLLRQYKSTLAAESVQAAFGDLESFKAEWNVGAIMNGMGMGLGWSWSGLVCSYSHFVPSSRCPRLQNG